ncbi:hypothetical protein BBK82_29805 [Lentzea guizhouensis]|uniref:Glycosyl transferase family 1 n=2 Tax=Lentzea guizhouensis TaxID=1586287 RepID=A0A1B2HZK3_9PSEU|nr:hypothetical protein BBK82_29805 [Lentzea guizhouensis]
MRIAVVSAQASPLKADFGQGMHIAQLATALCESGHEVVVYTRRDDPAVAERVRTADGYEVVHVPAGRPTALAEDHVVPHLGEFAECLAQRWQVCPPDVVHTYGWTSALVGVIGAHIVRAPVVHSYTTLGADQTGQRGDAEMLVARRAAWIMGSSAQEATELWRLGVRRTQVSVVPCGVDAELFEPEGPIATRNALRRVLVAGEPARHNGFADVLTAMSAMDDAELVVVGAGDQAELRELAGGLGVLDRVVFTGHVPQAQLPALVRSADVVVCVPWSDPFGITALQAMACGVPVVATTVGALKDIVVHDVTGLHVPARKPVVLARALRQLLADDTWREEFGIAARDRVVARYSRDRLAEEALAVYARVAGRGAELRNR